MIKYRVVEEQILEEGLSFNDALTVVEMLNEQGRRAKLEDEIERMFAGAGPAWKPAGRITHSEVFESSYEEAMIKFEKMVDKVVML